MNRGFLFNEIQFVLNNVNVRIIVEEKTHRVLPD